MTPQRAKELANNASKYTCGSGMDADVIAHAILQACAEQREEDAMICDTTAEFHGFYGTAAKDAAVKIRGQT